MLEIFIVFFFFFRSSHSSLSSTNPFESEIESDINNINGSQLSLRTKTYRKKRKAPSAPTKIMVNLYILT